MKKARNCLLALTLCLLMLCGCARAGALPAVTEAPASAPIETALPAPADTPAPEPEDDPFGRQSEEEKRIETLARTEDMPVFGDMVYERPDPAELEALIAAAEEAMNDGESYEVVEPLLDDCFLFYYHFDTM